MLGDMHSGVAMPISREKEERMWTLAYEMARSGDYVGWWDIEVELRSLGYPRARQLLDNEQTREKLDRMCAEAQKGRAGA